jgi:hypothetical protein
MDSGPRSRLHGAGQRGRVGPGGSGDLLRATPLPKGKQEVTALLVPGFTGDHILIDHRSTSQLNRQSGESRRNRGLGKLQAVERGLD